MPKVIESKKSESEDDVDSCLDKLNYGDIDEMNAFFERFYPDVYSNISLPPLEPILLPGMNSAIEQTHRFYPVFLLYCFHNSITSQAAFFIRRPTVYNALKRAIVNWMTLELDEHASDLKENRDVISASYYYSTVLSKEKININDKQALIRHQKLICTIIEMICSYHANVNTEQQCIPLLISIIKFHHSPVNVIKRKKHI